MPQSIYYYYNSSNNKSAPQGVEYIGASLTWEEEGDSHIYPTVWLQQM